MHFKALLVAGFSASLVSAQSLSSLIGSTPQLSSLAALLKAYPSIGKSLDSLKNVTVFAPNNAAIAALQSSGALNNITQAEIAAILDYHVVDGKTPASDITATPLFAPTMLTEKMYTTVTGGQVVEAALVDGDVIITTGLKSQSKVVSADHDFDGGIAHIVDSVLVIPPSIPATALAADLTAFLGAVVEAGLASTLEKASDITVFAPSNDAFAAIASAAGGLSKKQLAGILEYHVISGTVAYSTTLKNESVATLEKSDVTITIEDGAVFVNAARVINADILISGGVLHVIDSVLNPNDASAKPEPNSAPVVQFSGASSAPIAALTSGLPAASTTVSALVSTDTQVAAAPSSSAASASSPSSSALATASSGAASLPTAVVDAAALFGAAALFVNW